MIRQASLTPRTLAEDGLHLRGRMLHQEDIHRSERIVLEPIRPLRQPNGFIRAQGDREWIPASARRVSSDGMKLIVVIGLPGSNAETARR